MRGRRAIAAPFFLGDVCEGRQSRQSWPGGQAENRHAKRPLWVVSGLGWRRFRKGRLSTPQRDLFVSKLGVFEVTKVSSPRLATQPDDQDQSSRHRHANQRRRYPERRRQGRDAQPLSQQAAQF